MKPNELIQPLTDDRELNTALDRMAEEVPPMPADFHARWTAAVRAEALRAAPSAKAEAEKKPIPLAMWTRILSVAAAFVFLIGGTLLYRNGRGTLNKLNRPDGMQETTEAAEAAEGYTDTGIAPMMAAAPRAYSLNGAEPDASAAGMDAALSETEEAEETAEEVFSVTADEDMAEAAEPEEEAEEPEEAAEAEAGEAEGKRSFLQEAGSFFTDMGDFLLAALPYLLVLAVPAVIALIIRHRKQG